MLPQNYMVIMLSNYSLSEIAQLLSYYYDSGVNTELEERLYDYQSGIPHKLSGKPVSNQLTVGLSSKASKASGNSNKPKQEQSQSQAKAKAFISSAELVADINNFADLQQAIKSFDGCELKKHATNTVISDGVANADIMLIGEAPGASEDVQGIPFCGESGQLLDKMLSFVNISRKSNLLISNSIFWRPPSNRKPSDEEIAICRPFVIKMIELVNPKLLIMCGGTATKCLMGVATGITRLRGQRYHYDFAAKRVVAATGGDVVEESIPAFAIFHPAYILRSPAQKKYIWHDLLMLRDCYDNL